MKRKRVTNLEDAIHDLNSESRPFSNYHQHIFQNEAWYLSIPMKSSLIYMWMKTYNHVKGRALGLAFKKKPKLIQKWVFNNTENYFKNTLTKPSQDTNLGSNQGIIEISNFFLQILPILENHLYHLHMLTKTSYNKMETWKYATKHLKYQIMESLRHTRWTDKYLTHATNKKIEQLIKTSTK